MASSKRANTRKASVARDKGGKWIKGTPSPNPAGRPPLGESWREIFDKAGKLTKQQLLDLYPIYGKRLAGLPSDVPLRDAVALSAMVTLACEPSPGLLATIIERVDGKVAQPIAFETMTDEQKREYVRDLLAAGGYILSGPAGEGLSSSTETADRNASQ